MTLLRVNVGGLDFFGDRGPYAIAKEGFTGWDDNEYRSTTEARVNSHGNYPTTSYRDAKTVNLNGYILGGSADQLNHRMDLFTQVLIEGQVGKISVERPWGLRWANCQVTSRKTTEVGGLNRATFSLAVRIDDPRRFGNTERFSTPVGTPKDVYQRGTAEAHPLITVTGSMPGGYEIILGPKTIVVTRGIASGQTHTIDTRTGILRSNGSVVVGGLGLTELFTVKPGLAQNLYSLPRTSGSGTVHLDVTETFS